jgi:hypothetical protein
MIEVSQDVTFQFRVSRFQRISKLLLLLLLVCALAGLFGGGSFLGGYVRASERELSVEFERFLRYDASHQINIDLTPADTAANGPLWLDIGYLRLCKIESITPTPEREYSSSNKVFFRIRSDPQSPRSTVSIRYRPMSVGRLVTTIGLGSSKILIKQFVYP